VNVPPDFEKAAYGKVTRRMVPFLFLCYVLAYVDRVNVGFAKLQMQQALGMSDTVYGLAAGIFFIGYFFFEVPANMIMQRIGARLWLGPIMAVWRIVSAATMSVTDAKSFYRFLLGIVECGFFPGVILYLTYWHTRKHRAKMVAAFMTAVPISGLVASPLSGWILTRMTGVGHLRAWQWLFLIEGVPSVIVGLVTLYYLTDNPTTAKWLSADERALLLKRLQDEEEAKKLEGQHRHRLVDAFKSGRVWLLSLIHFGMIMGNYGLGFWLPQTVKDRITSDPWHIGLILVIPWGLAAVIMVLWGHHSDTTGGRRGHRLDQLGRQLGRLRRSLRGGRHPGRHRQHDLGAAVARRRVPDVGIDCASGGQAAQGLAGNSRSHHQLIGLGEPDAPDLTKAGLAEPGGVFLLAVGRAILGAGEHIQRKQRGRPGRGLVRFHNEVLDNDPAAGRQRLERAPDKVPVLLRAQHMADRGDENQIVVLAEGSRSQISRTGPDSARETGPLNVSLRNGQHRRKVKDFRT
jgi:MFS family permease